ncbi:MAG TPA: DUF4159 domain-containing protein [Fimbriiglobus sp.]|nr:DUF4159 domain-containing protein [Fimbriiglobus sp.]
MLRRVPPLAVLVGLLALLFVPTPSPAAPPPSEEDEFVRRVNRAIDRGVQYLKSQHKPKTHWEGFWLNQAADMEGGVTALGALALLNCGEKPDSRELKAALDYLRSLPPKRTYVVGLSTMVFAEARLPRDLPTIQKNVNWLIENATRSGGKITGWSYPFADGNRPDGSNTQYAVLGLYAGKQAGAKIDDEVWKQIRQLYIDSQRPEGQEAGFWQYTESGGLSGPSFTMTVAGASGLVIAGMGLNESRQGLDPATGVARNCGKYDSNGPLQKGMNWIARYFAYYNARESKSDFYNIYGIERVGRLSGQRFIGRTDWYRDGCELLVREQNREGAWSQKHGIPIDGVNVIATSFALLFLSKGRTPVLISKLAYGDFVMPDGKMLVERGPVPGVVGWNRKHNDARHLTEFASKELFGGLPLGWQVYDPRRKEFNRNEEVLTEVGVLVQSPILYLNGHHAPALKGQQEEILKKYLDEGGFVLAEACCGSEEFATGFRALMKKLYPASKLQPMPPEHPIWQSFFAVPPTTFPKLEYMDSGCRTVVVFSPEPLAGYWEEAKYMAPKGKKDVDRGGQAYRLAANVIAYATGMEPPKQRGTSRNIASGTADRSPPKGFIKPAQIRLPDENPPAEGAMRNLMAHLKSAARIDAVLEKEPLPPGDDELFKYKFMYLHGRRSFNLADNEIENIKSNLQAGGLLLADACCGKKEFDQSFRAMVEKMFPGQKLEVIPPGDELYSARLNGGTAITSVKRREKAGDAGAADNGFNDLPPHLEGIKLDGRWVLIYSKYDIGCALEGHKSTDCLGHTRDSAQQLATAAVLYALKR